MVQEILKIRMDGMRNLCIILLAFVLTGYGCAPSLETQRRSIALSVSMDEVYIESALQTKADEVTSVLARPYSGTPSVGNPFDVALWLSYTAGSYSHRPELPQYIPCAVTSEYTSTNPTDVKCDGQLVLYPIQSDDNYPTVGDDVYCVGFHPSTGWGDLTETPVNSASHVINGSEDLMFADQLKGSYVDNFTDQTFKHLTTWVKMNLSATSKKAAEIWGEVTDLEIVSPDSEVVIGFSEAVDTPSTVSYSGEPAGFDLALMNNKLSITNKTFGQAFCAPPARVVKNAAGKYEYSEESGGELGYIVRVKTSNLPEKEVFVELKKEDMTAISNAQYAIGKLFVMTLHFNDVAVVEGVCTLRQWDDQISDIYLK